MGIALIIVLIIAAIIMVVVIIKHLLTKSRIKSAFENGNVIVTGRKGYGKDILFNAVINWRKKDYHSNLNYGGNYHAFDIKDLELTPNTYHNFINGDITQVQKNKSFENSDIYISDGGVYLPSQADYILHKTYPSLPITYALNRHLYNNGIHVNAQRIERIWKSLREQADYFILMRKRPLKMPFFMVIFTTEYDRYESAKRELLPMNNTLFNKYSKAEKDLFRANNGFVKNGMLIIRKNSLKYDSRAFHEIIFGEKIRRAPTLWEKIKSKVLETGSNIKKMFSKDI